MKQPYRFIFSIVSILLLAMVSQPLFSSENHIAVPLDHRVYPVLRSAELRGIIDTGMQVRPYATSTVLRHLDTIDQSDRISEEEHALVRQLIGELAKTSHTDNEMGSMLRHGSYKTYSETLDTSAEFGARLNFSYVHSLVDADTFDSRNGGDFYLRGDIKNIASFHMNIGIRFDHLDHRLFLKNDFTIPSEGKYDTLWDHDGEHLLYYGLYYNPELSISLLKDTLRLRWASTQRDWGVGRNNLMLSSSARSFNGIELSYDISSWMRYAFITGTLGKFDRGVLDNSDGFYSEYHFSESIHNTLYDNNFSAHRVEVDLPYDFTFGIYESVIYRKRFEFGYLNPLSVIMFEQNIMGDFDNMLAGVDLEWSLPGMLRVYGGAATTEMNEINPKRFFIAPRNILSFQGGMEVDLPFLSFSTATLQYTYLAPFFYTHYPQTERIITGYEYDSIEDEYVPIYETRLTQELSYVNKGENLGYPLRPNSDEILLGVNVNAPNGWDGNLAVKYQRRSGQYGFNIDKYMRYAAAKDGRYPDKDFNGNIFEETLGLNATVNKTLGSMPIKLSVSYMFSMNRERETLPVPIKVWDDAATSGSEYQDYNPTLHDPLPDSVTIVEYAVSGPWAPWNFSHALQVGVSIWY